MRRQSPLDLDSTRPEEIFERLYPPRHGATRTRAQWTELRDEFIALATEFVDDDGRRLGLAVLGENLALQNPEMKGVVLLDGLQADEHTDFIGYMRGKPGRASRDNVELACTAEQLRRWITSQEQRLREKNSFGPSQQLELSEILYRAKGNLRDDHHIAMTSNGLITLGDIETWAAERDEIFFSYGWPCDWETRPPALRHRPTGTAVTLPEGWLVPYLYTSFPFLDKALPRDRDTTYEQHRHDHEDTWQRRWWLASDVPEGLVLQRLCDAWSCQPEDLLAPVAKRDWDDHADPGIPGIAPAPILHLHRP